jgi:thioredoxin-related protein
MKIKSWLISLLALALVAHPAFAAQVEWFTDINAAVAKAKAENKFIMLDFTGSDWCIWCQRLKSEIFDQPEFAEFASVNFVMVEVDFPHDKPQTPAQQQINKRLAQAYHVDRYPTLIVLNSAGDQVGAGGYLKGGPNAFIAAVEKIPGVKHVDPAVTEKAPEEPEPPRKPADYTPIAPTPPVHYGALALKGISGTKDKRLALINNQTMMAGETASVKVLDGRVKVLCREIRDDSVLLTVDGKPVELKLAHK